MKRRVLLGLGSGLAVTVLTGFKLPPVTHGGSGELAIPVDLEPDGLAKTYRRFRLLIIGQRDDGKAEALAQASADVLSKFLPGTRSKTIRAADTRRVGVLIGTRQQDVGVMTNEGAVALSTAKDPFTDIRDVPLRSIVGFGTHVLVCRADFNARHAYQLAKTLSENRTQLPGATVIQDGVIAVHDGAKAFFAGRPLPTEAD